jgi:amino acid adenylation domain-containing protein
MTIVVELLNQLDQLGIHLGLEDGHLRVRGKKEALTADHIEALRTHKSAIVKLLGEQKAVLAENPLVARQRPSELALSFAQERLWFLTQLENTANAYNIALALQLQGSLQVEVLNNAINAVVNRYEILKTTFPTRDGIPYQRIAAQIDISLEFIELGHLSVSVRDDTCMRILREQAACSFNLAQSPLIRASLIHLAENEHVLLFCIHHIVADGWSLGVLMEELNLAYQAISSRQPASASPPMLHYADYALWQRKLSTTDEWQRQLEWWQQHLADTPTVLGLPTDHLRPLVQDGMGDTFIFGLNEALTTELERLGEQHGASLFMTIFALWAILLGRYSNEDDLVIGTPIANRHRPGLDSLIGCFVNTLPLRVDLSGNTSFIELLGQLRQVTLNAYANQDIPFEQLVNELNIERSLSHSPLFQVMLAVEYGQSHPAARKYSLGDLQVSWLDLGRDYTELDLSIELVRTNNGMRGWLDYSKALFEPATIERMAGHFQILAEGVVADHTCKISSLPLLTAAEHRQLLHEWNPIDTHAAVNGSIQQLFEKQVTRTPNAVAVVVSQPGVEPEQCDSLTYAQLNVRANHLALKLLELKPTAATDQAGGLDSANLRNHLVGVCLGRSANILVAILGILKAGCVYVPVDPTWPQQRVTAILDDAKPFALVTEPGLLDEAYMDSMITLFVNDGPVAPSTDAEISNLPIKNKPEDAAYVMFTSGSTGIPKGVVIEHRNVVSYVQAFVAWTNLTAADRSLQHGSIAFDISIEEIFPLLSVGGTVVICTDPSGIDNIVDDSIRHHVTMVCATPLLMQYYNSRAHELTSLRFLASGGDVLRPEDIDRLLIQDVGVYNSYGPTETTVTATSHWVRSEDDPLPIGAPLPNTRVLVLDAQCNPVPIGVPGELYIGGMGVGRGYLNRPELNTERFITWHNNERLYRTGDRARWRADRTLEFVGRMDRQVKIRGFRVELGEIEAAISLHAAVSQVAVLPYVDADSQKRLVAYIVPASAANNSSMLQTTLREHLRQSMPNYMIPGAFMVLDVLPLTSTGKIDRKALPAPQESDALQPLQRPRSVIEQDLLSIWRNVLQNNVIGIFGNFFELGGHSLLAVRLMAQVSEAFDTELPLQALFRYPTVAELASYLEQSNPALSWSTLVALQPHGDKAPLLCVPGDGGNVFYFYPLVKELGSDQPVYGLESLGLDGKQTPHATVEAAATHHIQKIRERWPHGPYCLAGHSFGGLVVYEIAQQLIKAGQTVNMLAIMDTLPPSMPLPTATESELMMIFEELFAEEYGLSTSLTLEQLERLTSEQRLEALKLALEKLEALPVGATIAYVQGIFSVFRTNTQTEYHPHNVTKLPFELLLAGESPVGEQEDIIAGWSQFGMPQVHIVPGSHTTMTYPPHVVTLAEKLQTRLSMVDNHNPEPPNKERV